PPYIVAIYGTDIVAVFDQKFTVVGLFDLSAYVHPTANQKQTVVMGQATVTTAAGTTQGSVTATVNSITLPLTFAIARDGVLYVTHSNLSYASENQGQNAYVSALDLATGDPLWRSD